MNERFVVVDKWRVHLLGLQANANGERNVCYFKWRQL